MTLVCRPTRRAVLTGLALGALAAPLSAHESVKAIVVLRPGMPRVGEPCAIEVSVLAPPGVPVIDQIQRVHIVGEMSGHPMRPVEADLAAGTDRGVYRGQFALTMGGAWTVTLRITVAGEDMWATFPLEGLSPSKPGDTGGMRHVLELRDPERANLVSPWVIVASTGGLIVLLEALALLARRRRRSDGPGVQG